jgi:hypothetical protein
MRFGGFNADDIDIIISGFGGFLFDLEFFWHYRGYIASRCRRFNCIFFNLEESSKKTRGFDEIFARRFDERTN